MSIEGRGPNPRCGAGDGDYSGLSFDIECQFCLNFPIKYPLKWANKNTTRINLSENDVKLGRWRSIWNSNIEESGIANKTDSFTSTTISKDAHGDLGVENGFVIKASAENGEADWMVHYPKSDKDTQICCIKFAITIVWTNWRNAAGWICTLRINRCEVFCFFSFLLAKCANSSRDMLVVHSSCWKCIVYPPVSPPLFIIHFMIEQWKIARLNRTRWNHCGKDSDARER